MDGQLFRGAALGRDDENVQVAVAIARESDPLPIGRKTRVDIAGAIDCQPFDVLTVFVSGPNAAELAENNTLIVIVGITNKFRFAAKCEGRPSENQHQS